MTTITIRKEEEEATETPASRNGRISGGVFALSGNVVHFAQPIKEISAKSYNSGASLHQKL